MNALVTGATGLLGNNLVRRLLDQGHQVRVLVRANSSPRPLADLPITSIVGELSDTEAVRRAAEGADTVFHCAGFVKIGWALLEQAREVNVEGTRVICRAAHEFGARVVYVSTINTVGLAAGREVADEITPIKNQVRCSYVVTKTEAEQVVQAEVEKGLRAVIVNPGFMLGPWDWKPSSGAMMVEVASKRPPMAPSGGCSLVDVRDVAQGAIDAATQGKLGERYLLAGHNMSYLELWRRFARLTGGKGPFGKLGPAMRWIIGGGGDLVGKLRGQEGDVNSAMLRMGSQYHYYSSRKAEQAWGYRVRPAEETIQDAWQWFQANGYVKT